MLQEENLYEYLEKNSSPEPIYLHRLWRLAHIELLQPRMLSGHLQGRLLNLLVQIKKPTNILEIGTYSGYATLCMAEGLAEIYPSPSQEKGMIHTIEVEEELKGFIEQQFASSPYADRIVLHINKAESLILSLVEEYTFDFIFIDGNKRSYSAYYDLLIEKIPSGSLIIADNTLWDGKVYTPPVSQDNQTQSILRFNKKIREDNRVEVVILPIRDGLSLILKK